MPRFQIINFGCRANQADGSVLQDELSNHGLQAAIDGERPDIAVLNSCTVTAGADYSLRQAARRLHRENPAIRILITGCYAQRCPEELAALPGVAFVVGNSHKEAIAQLLCQNAPTPFTANQAPLLAAGKDYAPLQLAAVGEQQSNAANHSSQFLPIEVLLHRDAAQTNVPHFSVFNTTRTDSAGEDYPEPSAASAPVKILHSDLFAHTEPLSSPAWGGVRNAGSHERTRPNLKIQDGCGSRCSFCIIPSVRGRSRSLPHEAVLKQIRSLCQAGYREVVLSGINLGRYGRDLENGPGRESGFLQLLRSILQETTLERLRLSSVEPMDFSDQLLDLMASSPRIAKHVHAPLQSGSGRILRLMQRRYHPENYRDRIEAAYQRMPNAAFGADVMAGFPGESEQDFNDTRSLIASLPFTYLHIFPFSRRPGTPAEQMKGHVHGTVIRERVRVLRELAAEKNLTFRRKQLGRTLEVVTLHRAVNEDAQASTPALSDHFLNVSISGARLPANQLIRVRVSGLCGDGLAAMPETAATT